MDDIRINPASVFLRTLREGPGAQSAGTGELPIKRTLLILSEGPLSREELALRLSLPRATVDDTIRNLASLELIQANGLETDETISLSELGKQVAANS